MNTTKEKIKTVLICVLIVGMVYLTYSVWFFDNPFGEFHLDELINIAPSGIVSENEAGADLETFGIRPLSIIIRDEKGARGAVYDDKACTDIYSKLRGVISEAITSASAVSETDAKEWSELLTGGGIYIDYGGNVPVDALNIWLGGKDGNSDICARSFVFSTEKKKIRILAKSTVDGRVYACESNTSSQKAAELLATVNAEKVAFAAEQESEDFRAVRPEMIITDITESPAVISAYNSYATFNAEVRNACLESFGLNGTTPSTYSEQDGTEVFVADMITLKISPAGIVSYSDPRERTDETLGLDVSASGITPTFAEATEAARKLAASIASKLPTAGGIYLISASRASDETELVFGRHMGGIPVDMNGTAYFARIVISGTSIRAAKINLRGYDTTAQNADILSEKLAAAAVSGSGKKGELNLRYNDSGEQNVSPAWFIGGVRKKNDGEVE